MQMIYTLFGWYLLFLCVGCGLSGPDSVLRPEGESIHRLGHKQSCRRWQSHSKTQYTHTHTHKCTELLMCSWYTLMLICSQCCFLSLSRGSCSDQQRSSWCQWHRQPLQRNIQHLWWVCLLCGYTHWTSRSTHTHTHTNARTNLNQFFPLCFRHGCAECYWRCVPWCHMGSSA